MVLRWSENKVHPCVPVDKFHPSQDWRLLTPGEIVSTVREGCFEYWLWEGTVQGGEGLEGAREGGT